jgi:hypothetical protein
VYSCHSCHEYTSGGRNQCFVTTTGLMNEHAESYIHTHVQAMPHRHIMVCNLPVNTLRYSSSRGSAVIQFSSWFLCFPPTTCLKDGRALWCLAASMSSVHSVACAHREGMSPSVGPQVVTDHCTDTVSVQCIMRHRWPACCSLRWPNVPQTANSCSGLLEPIMAAHVS